MRCIDAGLNGLKIISKFLGSEQSWDTPPGTEPKSSLSPSGIVAEPDLLPLPSDLLADRGECPIPGSKCIIAIILKNFKNIEDNFSSGKMQS